MGLELQDKENEYEETMNVQVSDNDENFLLELNNEIKEEEEMNTKVSDPEAKHMNIIDPNEEASIINATYEMNNAMAKEQSAEDLLAQLDNDIGQEEELLEKFNNETGSKDEVENNEVITEIESEPSTEILELMKELDKTN